MNAASLLLLLLLIVSAANFTLTYNNDCKTEILSEPRVRTAEGENITFEIYKAFTKISNDSYNFSLVAEEILTRRPDIVGVFLVSLHSSPVLAINVHKRLKLYSNRTSSTQGYWKSIDYISKHGWSPPFRDCYFFFRTWLHAYVVKEDFFSVAFFMRYILNQCDPSSAEIFYALPHNCDEETTECIPRYEFGEKRGGYWCVCKDGYFYSGANETWKGFSGEDIEFKAPGNYQCLPCPSKCDICESGGICTARRDLSLKTVILGLQLACMCVTVILALVVFKQRKCKAIASGMWTILETILLGVFILYSTVIVRFFEPSVIQCLVEPWTRELGFIICYGAIILKLYRHLIEFRTRKAHRWVVKDTDLLKYLLIMTLSVLAYMAAYTSISLNFMQENYSLLYKTKTSDGVYYETCKPLWWDYVTETGELTILIFGIHLSYASRNARTQFHERNFLCAAISIELAVSTIFYILRVALLPELHPNLVLIAYCVRTQLTSTMTLLLVFVPKFWYQQKQVRSLAQEYSCRIPVDAFKDVNAHGPLTSNNSDVDIGEVTLADMSPDDIRAELKRLYMQLEIFKNKTICRDNPHISKRRGGRKAQHRRFSLQKKGSREKNLHGKHRVQKQEQETTEAEQSRTPEDSVCSNEGPSAIYNDLPSTTHSSDHK